jgi:hypothetical protein
VTAAISIMFRFFLLIILSLAPLHAAPVTLEEKGDLAILSNGIITATVGKNSASIESLAESRFTKFARKAPSPALSPTC